MPILFNFVGLVLDGKIDFAADSFGITEIRSRVISYLPLFSGGKSRIYIKNPRETFDWEIYTKPFRKVTWVGVMSFSIILPILMVIAMVNCKSNSTNSRGKKILIFTTLS